VDDAPIELDVTLEPADMAALTRKIQRRSRGRLILLVLILVSLLAGWLIARQIYPRTDFIPLLVTLDISLVICVILILSFRGIIFRKAYGDNSYFFAPRHYTIDAKGVNVNTAHTHGFFAWAGIAGVEKSKTHIFVMLPGNTQAHVFPVRALPAAWSADNFAKQLEAWRIQAGTA
jgi:hypothetical protein